MATLFSNVAAGSGPTFFYSLSATEKARSSSTVTYAVTLSAHLEYSTSYYGETVSSSITIGSKTQSFPKMGPFSGTTNKSVSMDVVVSASATTSSLSYKLVASGDLGGSQGDISRTGTLSCSIYATTPDLDGSVTIKDGSVTVSAYYAEDIGTGSFSLSWPAMTGANGSKYYELERSTNGGTWTDVSSSLTSTSTTHPPGSSTTSIRYRVRARNTVGSDNLYSGWIYSATVKKNVMSAPTISSTSVVYYTTRTFAMSLVKATDNMGSSMSYTLSATNANTVISGTMGVSPGTITVNTNNGTSGTYMTFDNLKKAALSGAAHSDTNDYKGTIDITVTATNGKGSSKTDTVSVVIDLGRDAPVVGTPTINIDSTSYFTISAVTRLFPEFKSVKLNIPTVIKDALGRNCSYDIMMREGLTQKVIKSTPVVTAAASATVNHVEAGLTTSKKAVAFTAKAKTFNGMTGYSVATPIVELHYYKKPSVTSSSISRIEGSASFKITITPNNSLTGATNTSTIPAGYVKTASTITSGVEKYSVNSTTVLLDTYTAKVPIVIRDSIGYILGGAANDVTLSVTVSKFRPALSIREKGIGINTYASDNEALRIVGNSLTEGSVIGQKFQFVTPVHPNGRNFATAIDGDLNGIAAIFGSGGLTVLGGGESALAFANGFVAAGYGAGTERTYITSDASNYIVSGMDGTYGLGHTWQFGTDGSITLPNSASVNIDQYGNFKIPTGASSATWSVFGSDGKAQLSIPLGANNAKKITLGQFRFYSDIGIAGDEDSASALVFREYTSTNTEHILVKDDTNGFYFNGDQVIPAPGNTGTGNGQLFAAKFNVVSDRDLKENIVEFNEAALPKLRRSKTYRYNHVLSDERKFQMKKKGIRQETSYGLIAQEAPEEITINDGKGIDLYAMSTMLLKGLQELADKVDYLDAKSKKR